MATKKSEEEVSMLTRPALHFEMSSSIAKLALAQTKVQKEIKKTYLRKVRALLTSIQRLIN